MLRTIRYKKYLKNTKSVYKGEILTTGVFNTNVPFFILCVHFTESSCLDFDGSFLNVLELLTQRRPLHSPLMFIGPSRFLSASDFLWFLPISHSTVSRSFNKTIVHCITFQQKHISITRTELTIWQAFRYGKFMKCRYPASTTIWHSCKLLWL